MKLNHFIALLFVVIATAVSLNAHAQTRQLESEIANTERKLKEIQNKISVNKKNQKSKQQLLNLLTEKINVRKTLISNIDKSIASTKKEMGHFSNLLINETKRIDSITDLSENISIQIYKSLNNNELTDESNLNYVLNSLDYIYGQIDGDRKNSDSIKNIVGNKYNALMVQNKKLVGLLSDKNNELVTLYSESREQDALRKKLKSEESNLEQQSDNERKKLTALQKRIEEIILAEAMAKRTSLLDIGLNKNFAATQGKLQSPMINGYIVERYGTHPHPTKPTLKVKNTGVNMRSKTSKMVNVVFSGVVRSIFVVPGMGSSILVRHGNYLTVYSNLATVSVKKGDNVYIGHTIGQLQSTSETLHFEIWNETKNLNPEKWVKF